VFRGSRDETKTTLESKQGLGHVKEINNSWDCYIQTRVQDQPKEASSTWIGARIGTFYVDKLYQ
jgi:hypothetical protein